MIGAKKRFEVLKRDGFRCQYCGKNGKDVTLEVDHIIPKSKGGKDTMDNLVCSCRECNIGKGSDLIEKPAKNLYKQKISDNLLSIRQYLYTKWNKQYMGTINKNTSILISIYLKELYGDQIVLDGPYGDEVKLGLDFCDKIISMVYTEALPEIDDMLEEIYNDSMWVGWNKNNNNRYGERLNYKITELLSSSDDVEKYVLYKYSLYPKLINNGKTEND